MDIMDWTPNGSQTRSKVGLGPGEPRLAQSARGTTVKGSDGVTYLDWISGLGAIGLGYQYPSVERAVRRQMAQGTCLPLPTRLEGEVAEQLCRFLEWPEQARWIKTGSEACAGAILIARAATGRRGTVSIGYHGWHPDLQPGPDLVEVPWGDTKLATKAITGKTACVLLEVCRDLPPPSGYAWAIQERAKAVGAIFAIDEMVTGFRWAQGGATKLFGLNPDLACFGKALGNGYPIAAIVGRRYLMQHARGVSSTFGGEGVGLAAARAVLKAYASADVVGHLWAIGTRLMGGCPFLVGYPCRPYLVSADAKRVTQAMRASHILIHPSGLTPTFSHTLDDAARTADALCQWFDQVGH